MTIASIINFEVILMDTKTEMVSVNNLLKQTGIVYRMIFQLLNTEGFVPKRRGKMKE